VNLANVKTINPRPPLRMDLRINFGLNITDGNTNTQNIYGEGEFVARTDKNRYTIGAIYSRSEDENVKTEDSAIGYMKYDHFFTKKWYGYANATAEKDEFKDLDLRTSLGIGAGYQFIESERTNLSLELGPSYVNEDYIVAEDNSYIAGRWGLKFEYYILPKSLQYFLYHTGWQSLEESEDLTLYTQTGFRIPLYKRLNLTAQFNWEYDKSPSPGKEKNDYTYILTIGYLWSN
jgi:putative salt-induced outer membrane protein YdiY